MMAAAAAAVAVAVTVVVVVVVTTTTTMITDDIPENSILMTYSRYNFWPPLLQLRRSVSVLK